MAESAEWLEAAWWKNWWEADLSWTGLAGKPVGQNEDVTHGGAHGERNLQDYWRRHPKTGAERDDAALLAAGELIAAPDGRLWHQAHVPLHWQDGTPAKADWDAGLRERLAGLVAARMAAARKTRTGFEGRTEGPDHRAQLSGTVLLDAPTGSDALHLVCDHACLPAWDAGGLAFRSGFRADNALFRERAAFRKARFSAEASFGGASFAGGADFGGAEFAGSAWFIRAAFVRSSEFGGATFQRLAWFQNASFAERPNFQGSTFSTVANFSEASFPARTGFASATFNGLATFDKASFTGDTSFYGVTFSQGASFNSATFHKSGASAEGATSNEGVNFGGATITGYASFDNTHFGGRAWFDGVTFSGIIRCYCTSFDGDAAFGQATFTGDAAFQLATFAGRANFGGATFAADAAFDGATFASHADFTSGEFVGQASFTRAKFLAAQRDDEPQPIANFTGRRFKDLAHFTEAEFHRRMVFQATIFERLARFDAIAFPATVDLWQGLFSQAQFKDVASFRGAGCQSFAAFDGAVLGGGLQLDSPGETRTQDRFREELGQALRAVPPPPPPAPKMLSVQVGAIREVPPETGREAALKSLERGCRVLKQAMEKSSDKTREQIFYAFELTARRHQRDTPGWERFFSRAYALTGDYGRSIARPIVFLLATIPLFALFYWLLLPPRPGQPDLALALQSLTLSLGRVFPFGLLQITSPDYQQNVLGLGDTARSLAIRTLATLQSLLAIVFAFLAALALRRRFQIS